MTDAASARPPADPLTTLLGSDRFAHAFTMTAFLVVCCRTVIERTAGIATYVTMVAVLSVLAVAVLLAHRRVISLPRLTTPLAVGFVGWAALSLLWNTDPQAGLVSAVSIVAIALVGVAIANTRDTLEVVHALANVARIVLVLSLALELLAGVFLDHPIDILGIQGNIASLGPVQGIFGTRNALGFTAVMAIVTFVIEWRANTVSPWLSLGSVLLAGALALLTGSPIVLVVAIAGAVATSVLLMVRHTRAPYRSAVQWTLGAAVLASIVLAYLLRQRLITLIGADNDINARYDLWLTVLRFVRSHPFRGWGWFGPWIPGDMPFSAINASLGTTNLSALNAFFDALLQLGWIGFVLFFALCATAFVRSWIDASNRRSVVYAWTPLVLVALIVYSFFESFALSGFGWLLLVVCATRAYEHQSLWEWRGRLGRM